MGTTGNLSSAAKAVRRVQLALRMTCASLPHLSGVANLVRIVAEPRIGTAGITASGKLLVNPEWFNSLDLADATFVAAHELLHLCLESHQRGQGTDHQEFNWAHDYIINDMLAEVFDRRPPGGGLEYPGARDLSAEKVVRMMRSGQIPPPVPGARSNMRAALEDAGLLPPSQREPMPGSDDVVSSSLERELFPHSDPADEREATRRVRGCGRPVLGLAKVKERFDRMGNISGTEPRGESAIAHAMRGLYAPPWELALQHWMEAAGGPRSYSRPSRRDAGHSDAIRAGRTRVGWTLHVVLDTSGSMEHDITHALGLIASFCESVGVGQVHIVQCDARVTRDQWVDPEELWNFTVEGFGGSDLSPAMLALADDAEVQAAIVITDGAIDFPAEPVPYTVLWAVTDAATAQTWRPGYGQVVGVPRL